MFASPVPFGSVWFRLVPVPFVSFSGKIWFRTKVVFCESATVSPLCTVIGDFVASFASPRCHSVTVLFEKQLFDGSRGMGRAGVSYCGQHGVGFSVPFCIVFTEVPIPDERGFDGTVRRESTVSHDSRGFRGLARVLLSRVSFPRQRALYL